jgi:hypothetical protein
MMNMLSNNINDRRRAGEAGRVAGLLILVTAALIVFSFLNPAVVTAADTGAFKGEVVAIDSYGKTFTVKSLDSGLYPMETAGELTFSLDRSTNVTSCEQNRTAQDIGVGERVSVTYHEKGGYLIADAVDIAPVFLACYDQ